MFSTIATDYITLLTDDNINNLYFPDLYKVDNLLDSTEDLKLIHLSHLRTKINEFKFDNTCNTIQRIQFPSVRLKWKQLTLDLCDTCGSYNNPYHNMVDIKDTIIKEFKQIFKLNAEFIINNRDKIISRIDELYLEKYDKKNEYECACGAFINKKNKIRHEGTMKHIKYFVNKEEK